MSQIQLYSECDCKGTTNKITSDTDDLEKVLSMPKVKSLCVSGEPWVVFSEANYNGKCFLYEDGQYNTLSDFGENIKSLRLVKGGLKEHTITVFELPNFEGSSKKLVDDGYSLDDIGMGNGVRSHKNVKGAWRLYELKNYQGKVMIALTEDKVSNYGGHQFTPNSFLPFKS